MFRDFTFKPQIKALPPSYGAPKDKDLPFHERVSKWQRERDLDASRRKEMTSQSELVDCTFRPRINKASARAVREIRGDQGEAANERLYKTNDLLQTQRSRFVEEQLRLERQSEEQECTFKPQLAAKQKAFKYVQPKYDKQPAVERSITAERGRSTALGSEYTFTPKVRGVGRSMSAARLYVK